MEVSIEGTVGSGKSTFGTIFMFYLFILLNYVKI